MTPSFACVVVFGGSAGGGLAIETAAHTSIAAVVGGEPTSEFWMGLYDGPDPGPLHLTHEVFPRLYTEEVRAFARSVLVKIDCPVLLLDGDPGRFRNADFRYIMRELEELGKRAKYIGYAGYKHGFFWGRGDRIMTVQEVDEVVEDVHAFSRPHLKTQPKPLRLLSSP
ncbi:MAG TPA: hypothetical protein VMN36_05590 [Verrucomicrobiales bacterium]|nr:hypothetical protein [Verrucomicrobiales bacterium]